MSFPVPRKDADGDYLLVVSGQLRKAPYLADWKAFKDHIRMVVKEQPGWSNVCEGKIRGDMQGWCRLKDKEDANSVYSAYSRQVVIHIFATSLRTGYWDLLKCNCNRHFGVGDRGHSPGRSGIDVNAVNQVFGKRESTSATYHAVPAQPCYQYANYYHATTYTPPSVYPYPGTLMQPVYSQSSAGLPVNLSRGAVITETRGIFLQGLNYSVGNSELATLLNNAGLRPEHANVHKDPRGASKGVATARFSTKAEAEYAVAKLNGTTHVGKTLTVRMDTNATVIGSLEPFVVDGTNKSGAEIYRRALAKQNQCNEDKQCFIVAKVDTPVGARLWTARAVRPFLVDDDDYDLGVLR
ncbi:hypothetical protein PMIN06_013045 [Paraphaeosphaeria minitans]